MCLRFSVQSLPNLGLATCPKNGGNRIDPGVVIESVITGNIRAGVCADYDATLVPTDEEKRLFYSLEEDPSGTKAPLCGLAMINGMPAGIISGNTVEYVASRAIEPIQDFILGSPFSQHMSNITSYALNGGYAFAFSKDGSEDMAYMSSYNVSKRMPERTAEILTRIMMEEVGKRIPDIVAGGYEPLPIRAGKTEISAFSPIFQNRAGVQFCLVGVFSEIRDQLLTSIRLRAEQEGISSFVTINPGGKHSIDGQMHTLEKRTAGQAFMEKYDLSHLIYLGDAVYTKADGSEGNDFPMVRNPNTFVFAVNDKSHPIPSGYEDGKISWIGHSPDASRTFLTWLLLQKADHIFQTQPARQSEIWDLLRYIGFCTTPANQK